MRKKIILKGLAGAAVLAGASQSYGTVVFRPLPTNIPGADPATGSSTPVNRIIDVDGNGTTDLRISYRSFTSGGFQLQQSFAFGLNGGQTACYGPVGAYSQYYAYEFGAGDLIPGGYQVAQNPRYLTQVVTNVNGYDYAIWYAGDRGFLGFTFMISGTLHYGFIEFETDLWTGAGTGGVKIFGLAYETQANTPIMAQTVPEPTTLAALAFGGAGLAAAAYRRRKKS